MRRKLFAFDIDGTLLNSEKCPLESSIEALRKLRQQGHLVTLATGRSRFLAQDVIRELDFSNYILCNGAAAFLDHEQVYQNLLNQPELERLIQVTEQAEISLSFIGLDKMTRSDFDSTSSMTEAMASFGAQTPEYDPDFYRENDIYQAVAFYGENKKALESEFEQFRFVRWHPEGVDVTPHNGSKAETILTLADRVGIDRGDIIAFGDGENDREMLQMAGVGVAMGNAEKHIQQEADFVTDTNDNDGIWKALRTLQVV